MLHSRVKGLAAEAVARLFQGVDLREWPGCVSPALLCAYGPESGAWWLLIDEPPGRLSPVFRVVLWRCDSETGTKSAFEHMVAASEIARADFNMIEAGILVLLSWLAESGGTEILWRIAPFMTPLAAEWTGVAKLREARIDEAAADGSLSRSLTASRAACSVKAPGPPRVLTADDLGPPECVEDGDCEEGEA